ncbi:MAG: glycoside hydrolase family 15 protein [Acidimicrobiales bacterium]
MSSEYYSRVTRERIESGASLFPPVLGSNSVGGVQLPRFPAREARGTTFPSISDYAFLSDCEHTCLVAPTGAVEWLCLPLPHDPSVFGSILDRSAGSFRLAPAETAVPAHRHYVPGTMVLETTWQARNGWLVVHDFLAVGPWPSTGEGPRHYSRERGEYGARHALVRSATCIFGTVDVTLNCEPSFDYGRNDAEWAYTSSSRTSVATTGHDTTGILLSGEMPLEIDGRAVRSHQRLYEGESTFVVLDWSDVPVVSQRSDVDRVLGETSHFWRNWIAGGQFPDHPWREFLQRSVLTLKGLTYTPSGALLAASTTSLPEQLGGSRNWDYRYTWLRDTAFALRALHSLGFDTEAEAFIQFLSEVLEPVDENGAGLLPLRDMQVLYPVDGTSNPPEVELDHLSGYAASKPVRAGNAAFDQTQFDIYGAVVDCIFEQARTGETLSDRSWRIVVHSVEAALQHWRGPDRGIWEIRGEPKHFTFSKVMCWVAADRGARMAELRHQTLEATRWRAAADEIHADVCEHGVGARGVFTQSYGSEELDASLLMLPLLGFLPPDDERQRATVFAIADELADGAFVYRYRTAETDDGLGGEAEQSFTICSFWLVSALVLIGELDLARSHCEKLIAAASSLGLYAEEIDPVTSRHFGNFPQALTHLALINAVLRVIKAEERASKLVGTASGFESWWYEAARIDDEGDAEAVA